MPNFDSDIGTLLHRDLSGERAQATTAMITQFHRPPGSQGYHAVTNLVANQLRQAGLTDIQAATYPLDGETEAGEGPLPLAWEPYGATVKVVSPVQEEIANADQTSSCLAWWSQATPEAGLSAELIDVGTGEADEDFAGKDLRGKIVLIGHTERPAGWSYAAQRAMEAGARGILSDYLFYTFRPERTRENHPEAVQLLRLPNQLGKYNTWACSISYPVGQRLRALLHLGPVVLHADIRCRLFRGTGQNLLATIPGWELPEESIFFISHCSAATRPCANCASGPALMVEIARVLHGLIERGEISQPRRSIRFLFLIEGLGSRVYTQEHADELDRIKCAFCFDSVGHDQGKLKSALLFYQHPDSSPSFINDYFAGVMERAPKDDSWVFRQDSSISPVQFIQAPYTPWSDNHHWAAYGVPSPLIMSWPDLHFHTQFLTADKTDPRVFRRAGITTALAAYEIANAGVPEALAIAGEVAAHGASRLAAIASDASYRIVAQAQASQPSAGVQQTVEHIRRELAFRSRCAQQAVESVTSLMPLPLPSSVRQRLSLYQNELEQQTERATARVEALLETLKAGEISA